MYFYLASTLSSGAFIADRLDGIWNRVVLAGADPGEIFLSHVISNSAIMILQSLEFLLLTKYIYKLENLGTDWIVMLMIVMVGLSAIIYGLAVSSQTDNYMTATFGSSLIFYPMMIMCGKRTRRSGIPVKSLDTFTCNFRNILASRSNPMVLQIHCILFTVHAANRRASKHSLQGLFVYALFSTNRVWCYLVVDYSTAFVLLHRVES